MFINKVIHYQKNRSVRYGTPKLNVRKFHCIIIISSKKINYCFGHYLFEIKT